MVSLHRILAGNVITFLEPLLLGLIVNAVSSSGVVVTLERNILHRLRSNCNIKSTETRLKNIKNVKGCRDGMPKSMQTR